MRAGRDSAYARIASDPEMRAALGLNAWERIGLARTLDAEGQEHRQDNNFTVSAGSRVIGSPDLVGMDLPDFLPMGPPARGSLEYPGDRCARPPTRPTIALSERHWQGA